MLSLPKATINRLMGLIETMHQTPGPDSVKTLAQELQLDLEDLLPLLSAARLLGWAVVKGGRYDLTAEGREVAEGDETQRKALFRARISTLPLIRTILDALTASARVPDEQIAELLSPTTDREEIRRQIETAVNWGRYAEILDYDGDERCFLPAPRRQHA